MDQMSINTPGIYYAIAYWIAAVLFIWLSPKRRDWKKMLVSAMILLLALVLIMTATDGNRILFVPLVLLYFFMLTAAISYNCSYDWKTNFYYGVRAFILGEFTASLEWEIYYFAVQYGHISRALGVNIAILVLVQALLTAFFYFVESYPFRELDRADIQIQKPGLLAVAMIAVAVFIISNLTYLIGDMIFGPYLAREIFVIRTLVDLAGVAILYAYHLLQFESTSRNERNRLQQMLKMQYENYQVLEKSMDAINMKYHDLKHQIVILKNEVGSEGSLAYLNQMEQEIRGYEAQNKTGNKILDTILTAKSIYCQNHWIELTCVADGESLSFLNPMDLSSLFGNLLDNAIESVEKISHKERRLIHLVVEQKKGFVRIRLENCYDKKPDIIDGHIRTTKEEKLYHGFGLKSIEATVKKYGGSVTVQADQGWFEQRILIPVQKKEEVS